MRQVREVLRLKHACGQSERQIAAAVGISRFTVAEYLRRATVIGITWPVPAGLDDAALEARLFSPPFTPREALRPQPDWPRIHAELRRPGVTLLLLWQEYRAEQPEGYGYSRFCDLYAEWRGGVSLTMRQTHVAGDKLFVDFAGQTLAVVDPATGQVRPAQVFVAVLGASSLTYAEVRWSQGLADWVGCHVNAFAFFGGAARQLVCDNLKAGVTAACRYEPGINRTYQEMAAHYGTAVVPTRVRKPRDKAKVEVGVQVVERWILARLRNRRLFGLEEANSAVRELLEALNSRPMRRLGTSRRALFESLERAALLPVPPEPYAYADWRRCRVGLDYHVEVTTTSRCWGTGTASPTALPEPWWRPASPSAGSSCSTTAAASPRMSAAHCGTGTPPSPSTCRARIGDTPTGRPPGCGARRPRSAPPRPAWSR
jgi:transposase